MTRGASDSSFSSTTRCSSEVRKTIETTLQILFKVFSYINIKKLWVTDKNRMVFDNSSTNKEG